MDVFVQSMQGLKTSQDYFCFGFRRPTSRFFATLSIFFSNCRLGRGSSNLFQSSMKSSFCALSSETGIRFYFSLILNPPTPKKSTPNQTFHFHFKILSHELIFFHLWWYIYIWTRSIIGAVNLVAPSGDCRIKERWPHNFFYTCGYRLLSSQLSPFQFHSAAVGLWAWLLLHRVELWSK